MRLPFPERIPVKTVFYAAALLCVVQLLERTDSTFSLLCFFFAILSGIAFNVAGGLTRPSGTYVFFFAVLGVLIGLFWKAVLGEPAQSNLQSPRLTMAVYDVGMLMMLVTAFLSRKVTLRRPLLGEILPDRKMQTATVGCLITGFMIAGLGFALPGGNGSAAAALNQLNHFFALAIILGVIHTIRRSGGRRSVSAPVLLAGAYLILGGIIGFSKEGLISPFVAWGFAAASQRYRITRNQILGGIFVVFFLFRYMVPYSQYGRNFKQGTISAEADVAINMLMHLGEVRKEYLETVKEYEENPSLQYYDSSQGLFDRLQMIVIDDALIDHTQNFGTYGLSPVVNGFENVVPHFIWKDKPSFLIGNTYAHEVGVLAPDDETTGVSFSPVSTAYHMDGWRGLLLVAPMAWFILFWVYDSLFGDIRKAPWGLVAVLIFAHTAPEGDISSIIYMFTIGAFSITVASVLTAYMMPVIGRIFIEPERTLPRRTPAIRSIPRRLLPAGSAES